MKNFVVELLSNRFGTVLATLNVCYFLSSRFPELTYPLSNFDKLMLVQNLPASILTHIPLRIIEFLFFMPHRFDYMQYIVTVFLFFVTLQWLFIAWLARKIALKIQTLRS